MVKIKRALGKIMTIALVCIMPINTTPIHALENTTYDINLKNGELNKLEDNGDGKGITKKVYLKGGLVTLNMALKGEVYVYHSSGEHIYSLESESTKENKSNVVVEVPEDGEYYFEIKETNSKGDENSLSWEIYYSQTISPKYNDIFRLSGKNDDIIIFNSPKAQTLDIKMDIQSTNQEDENPVVNLVAPNGKLEKELLHINKDDKKLKVKVDVKQGINIIEVYLTKGLVKWDIQVQPSYSDIDEYWAENEIRDFIHNGYTRGYEDGTFKPANPITRAEFVSIFNKVLSIEKSSGKVFDDTENHWAKNAIDIAVTNGVCAGKSPTEFKPDDNLTREEAAVMISNYKKIADENLDKLSKLKDSNSVSDWSKIAIEGVLEKGYMGGYSDNTFRPKENITRAEAVVTLNRIK